MSRFVTDMKKYWRYVIYAGQSELKTEIANSYLNWLWWIIEPLCFMLIYSFVFGVLFNSRIDHIQVFVYIGITFWDFFNRMIKSSVKCVKSYKSIVTKVYIPKYMLLLIKMYVNGFKMMICLGLLFIMLFVTRIHLTLYALWLIPSIIALFAFTFGICTFLLHFGVYIEDLANISNIVLRMLFYLTGVFYDLEGRLTNVVSSETAKLIGNINPIACFITSARDALMYGCAPHYKYLLTWLAIGIILSVLGIFLIYKNENNYVKVI